MFRIRCQIYLLPPETEALKLALEGGSDVEAVTRGEVAGFALYLFLFCFIVATL